MTPQDIREKTFEKAMFGGYDMAAVQNYQEEVATELANAQKEVAVLKGKMKVLVDKIEEYRASEDAMRLAILSAQKVGKQIEDDAQARADKILSEAKNTSDRILGGLQHETANEEAKLLNAKTSCAKFLEDVRNLCLTQLEYLDGVAGSKAASAPRPTASAAPASAVWNSISPACRAPCWNRSRWETRRSPGKWQGLPPHWPGSMLPSGLCRRAMTRCCPTRAARCPPDSGSCCALRA